MPRRSYTDADKAQALELYRVDGPTEVQRRLGIPKATVTNWAKAAGVETVRNEQTAKAVDAARLDWETRRLALAHRIGEVAEQALDLAQDKLGRQDAKAAKDAATTMAILVDKAQILTGGETGHQRVTTATRDAVLSEARQRALRLVPDVA